MKVYLDACAIQRPLDTPDQIRIVLEAEAEHFCTCDDRLLRKTEQLADLRLKVVSPLELVREMEK